MSNDGQRRDEIRSLLEGGLPTETQPRADSQAEMEAIAHRLTASDGSLRSKLSIAGFTLTAVESGEVKQSCETCMYYLVHRRHCELPALDLPVEPQWCCRLWRI